MKDILLVFTSGILGLLALSACAQQRLTPGGPLPVETSPAVTGQAGGPLGENTPPPPTDLPPASDTGGQKEITRADQGRTVSLNVGERFLLNLGDGYTWDLSISDPSLLSRVKNITVIRGAQGIYEAVAPGTVALNASGDPLCRQSNPPCGMPSILLEFTIQIK